MTESEKDFEFEMGEIKIHSTEVVDIPVKGLPYTKPVEIIVDAEAWQQMNQHAREDLRYEAGGIMLGDIYEFDDRKVVRVITSVPAREAVNNIASIQFTYQSWRQMEVERRQRAPTEKLIGWYHTHPGFTAFFSSTDHFMHENFFTQSWHVALVIDPINGEHTFYRWDNEQVVQSPDFLLQVTQWPGPEAPLNTVLALALERSADELQFEEDVESYALASTLRELAQCIPRVPSGSDLMNLLPLIVACAELEPDILADARRLMRRQHATDRPIRLTDIEYCGRNHSAKGTTVIADGWLVQQTTSHKLHLQNVEIEHSFSRDLSLPKPVRDLTVDKWGNVLILTRGKEEPLQLIFPPLARWPAHIMSGKKMQVTLRALSIEWEGGVPTHSIGKILMGRRYLYLLTKPEIYVLYTSDDHVPQHFDSHGVYPASICNVSSFEGLTDWTVDPQGNLYLLMAKTKEVWQFDPLRDLWQQLLLDEDLDKPVSLCAGQGILSIYDVGKQPSILQYGIPDGQQIHRRRIGRNLFHLGIQKIFSDGYKGLYFVTRHSIYYTR